ncbi:hypothetical protein I6M53_03245 [Shewanella algae]|uniref:hypothetical protein n=1 Tax=Shewanella algae TaxID=38313 RepID=UPI001AAD7152|nr:hypothetical protein [Shewanella algae]MBO2673682.1 hypothetical protein [Shewanella algae]
MRALTHEGLVVAYTKDNIAYGTEVNLGNASDGKKAVGHVRRCIAVNETIYPETKAAFLISKGEYLLAQ